MRLNIVLEVRVKLLVKELQGIGGCLMGNQLELNLGDTPNEDEFSKSKGKKTTGLDKGEECKNQEKYKGIYDVLEQATTHSKMEPLGIIKMNRHKPIVVLDAEYFLQIFFNTNKNIQG